LFQADDAPVMLRSKAGRHKVRSMLWVMRVQARARDAALEGRPAGRHKVRSVLWIIIDTSSLVKINGKVLHLLFNSNNYQ
jgi:hypothetical protein